MTDFQPVELFVSKGFSMEPFILDGDELIVMRPPGIQISTGDILLYRSRKHPAPVAHRLIGVDHKKQKLIMRSDANFRNREKVTDQSIIGKVVYLKRGATTIRVGKVDGSSFFNRWIVWCYPAVTVLKNEMIGLVSPALSSLQGTFLYRGFASHLFADKIRLEGSSDGLSHQWIAKIKGRFAGSVSLEERMLDGKRVAWISSLYVRARFRGAGIGYELIRSVQSFAEKQEIQELWVSFDIGNRAAESIYRRLGFRPADSSGTLWKEVGYWKEDQVILKKEIPAEKNLDR